MTPAGAQAAQAAASRSASPAGVLTRCSPRAPACLHQDSAPHRRSLARARTRGSVMTSTRG
jgi:hypothetical protein